MCENFVDACEDAFLDVRVCIPFVHDFDDIAL